MTESALSVEWHSEVTNRIMAHYGATARTLPWRSPPGMAPPDPYRVWLSEIMLQQTTVAAVKPYFEKFVTRWPDVATLANANDAEVMREWAGLGYYARARNLLRCARIVAGELAGQFPPAEADLLKLPGVGPYTAAAISAIAFGKRAVVVDGNVERVVARLFAVEQPLPAAKPKLYALADDLTPDVCAGDFAQAMMDLGATICTPRNPACSICPVAKFCKGRARATDFPRKAAKKPKPQRTGIAWWVERGDEVLLIRRDAKRMLGGMLALPSNDWDCKGATPLSFGSGEHLGSISHVFTHFALTLEIRRVPHDSGCDLPSEAQWCRKDGLEEAGLPSLFLKAVRAVLPGRD